MKKIFISFFILTILFSFCIVNATESNLVDNQEELTEEDLGVLQNTIIEKAMKTFGISDFLNEAKKYTNENFSDIDLNKMLKNTLTGEYSNNFMKNILINLLGKEVKSSISLIINIFLIIIIHSVLKAIIENLGNSSTGKIAYFVQYLIIVSLVTKSFITVLELTKTAINNLSNFMLLLVPLLTALIITTGCISISNIFQPVLIYLSTTISALINNLLVPILLVSVTLSIVTNFSKEINLEKLSKFFKSSIVWALGIVLTMFTCLLSVEGTLGSSVDNLTSKTTKAVVSNFIPVIGKVLSDSTETVIGCCNILKNGIGIIGLIVIVSIVLIPIIKVLILWITFSFTSAVCGIIADDGIVKLITQISDSYKILLAMLLASSTIFFIAITLVLKISNSVVS